MKIVLSVLMIFCGLACKDSETKEIVENQTNQDIICSNSGCEGSYEGPEFVERSDVAHQFSNQMSVAVGDKLKALYAEGVYNRVDFSSIEMTTVGMGSGNVVYYLSVPFSRVGDSCEAFTSFDHVGGWHHSPALEQRKKQLGKALMEGDTLFISELKTTPEGLEEYWIQWRNKITQANCQ